MEFRQITSGDDASFHDFMTAYYHEGEDKDTPQAEMDAFISCLFQMVYTGAIQGRLVFDHQDLAGVILWMKDTENGSFSSMPGYDTILEIGVSQAHRKKGIGKQRVIYAEQQMLLEHVLGYYVCAYGPAQRFWMECGYTDTGKTAVNGLPVFVKGQAALG